MNNMLRRDWLTLTSDVQLWTYIEVPRYFTNQQFLEQINLVREHVEELDCSRAERLTQEAFVQLSRDQIKFSKLRKLTMPSAASLPNLVYECLATANCFPALEELANVRPNENNTCEPIKCQAYFKQSKIAVLHDYPVLVYGRLKRPIGDQTVDKQKRQRWEADLAKAAISCQHIVEYRCWRSANYLDDKSIERLSVLFPNLQVLELHHCLVSEEGYSKFISHNREGCLRHLSLDRAPGLTDSVLRVIADHCSSLETISLTRCAKITPDGLLYLVTKCTRLKEIRLNVGSGSNNYNSCGCSSCVCNMREASSSCANIVALAVEKSNANRAAKSANSLNKSPADDDNYAIAMAENCKLLENLTLQNASSISQAGILALQQNLQGLHSLTLHNCCLINDACLELVAKIQSLNSVTIVNCNSVTPAGVIDLLLSAHWLTSFTFGCGYVKQEQGSNGRFDCDMADLAEHAYDRLSGSETGCLVLSNIKHLSLTGPIGGRFFNLVIILCSGLTNLCLHCHTIDAAASGDEKQIPPPIQRSGNARGNDLAKLSDIQATLAALGCSSDLIGGEEEKAELPEVTPSDLAEMIISCRKLRSLDISGVQLNDKFLHSICEHADNLRYLALHDGTEKLSTESLSDLIRLTPSLARLCLGGRISLDRKPRKQGEISNKGVDPEELLSQAQKLHRGRCYLHVDGGSKGGENSGGKGESESTGKRSKTVGEISKKENLKVDDMYKNFELSFTPLKFLGLFDEEP